MSIPPNTWLKHPDYPKGVFLNRDLPWLEIERIVENMRNDGLPKVTLLHKKMANAYHKRQFTQKPIDYRAMMDLIGSGMYYENRPPWLPVRAKLEDRIREKCAKLAEPRGQITKKHPMFDKTM